MNKQIKFGTIVLYWPPHLTSGESVDAGTVGTPNEIPAECPARVIGYGMGDIHLKYLEGDGRVGDVWVSGTPQEHPVRGGWRYGHWWEGSRA